MIKDNLFPAAAPDFSDPLGLLRACHGRILKHCEIVEKLADHLAENGLDLEATEAAAKCYRYFSSAAKHHHEDEEQDVFPRLARQSLKLADFVHALKQEHVELEALWTEIAPLLANPTRIQYKTRFCSLTQQFAAAYRNHVHKENRELLEIASDILSSDELMQIGRTMAERRGVK